MNIFNLIPIRQNGQKIDSGWWNTIRTKLIEKEVVITNIENDLSNSISSTTGGDDAQKLLRTDDDGVISGNVLRGIAPKFANNSEADAWYGTLVGGEVYYDTTLESYKKWNVIAATWDNLGASLSLIYATPEDFGAIGDGVTDDTDAVNAALATNKIVYGLPNKIYGVSGNITLPTTTHLENIHFKQLTPDNVNRKTLHFDAGEKCYMKKVTVDRNGDGLGGAINTSAGIWVNDCDNVVLEDVEVFGDDKGNGLALFNCDTARIIRPYIHDMNFGDSSMAAPTDDVLQGIFIYGGTEWVLDSPRVVNLQGLWTSQTIINRWTRGIAVGGASDFQINSPTVSNVDQGIDITGGDNPNRFSVNGGNALDCFTYGFKAANSVKHGSFTGCNAIRCGFAGFIASAPGSVISLRTSRLEFIGCHAIATGSNGFYNTTVSGFRVMSSGTYPNEPRAIRFIGCYADGSGGAMNYGFFSDVDISNSTSSWNTLTDCESTGATTLQISGFQQGFVVMSKNANQSIPNDTWTKVTLNTVDVDRCAGANTTDSEILARHSGFGFLSAIVNFAGSAIGTRRIRFMRNGVALEAFLVITAGDGNAKYYNLNFPLAIDPGDEFSLEVLQDSGGPLNVVATYTKFSLTYMDYGRGRS